MMELQETMETFYVWKITEGPYEDLEDGYGSWFVEAMVTDSYTGYDHQEIIPIFFDTFDDVYKFKTKVDRSMEPLEIKY